MALFQTKQDLLLDMREVCPRDVAAMLKMDVQATLCEEGAAQDALKDPAPALRIESVATLLKAKGYPQCVKNEARKVALCGSWTSDRLNESGTIPAGAGLGCGKLWVRSSIATASTWRCGRCA